MMTGAARAAGAQNASTLSPRSVRRRLSERRNLQTKRWRAQIMWGRQLRAGRRWQLPPRRKGGAAAVRPPTVRRAGAGDDCEGADAAPNLLPTPAPVTCSAAGIASDRNVAGRGAGVGAGGRCRCAIRALDAERSGIMRALARYQDAYRERSVKLLRDIYPSLPRETGQKLDRSFDDCRAYEVTFLNPQVALAPDDPTSATRQCTVDLHLPAPIAPAGAASNGAGSFSAPQIRRCLADRQCRRHGYRATIVPP